ncbi:uncharacterized protein C8Q71DRAFT_719465 [Rhodofomes roseus]|uniref:Uncharacterized protein n=1 Tax=Rhodofomes roseus TaxID=34475 RepID=A0ABQ8KYT7_9APHY|nr:uncharacterized protein C8Q71DRAFT_719465 [Rhodofomes roseus]KAH9843755.1 hypothetical protein C8Q71DRAFT_719465 [Rhodofomes roseus]
MHPSRGAGGSMKSVHKQAAASANSLPNARSISRPQDESERRFKMSTISPPGTPLGRNNGLISPQGGKKLSEFTWERNESNQQRYEQHTRSLTYAERARFCSYIKLPTEPETEGAAQCRAMKPEETQESSASLNSQDPVNTAETSPMLATAALRCGMDNDESGLTATGMFALQEGNLLNMNGKLWTRRKVEEVRASATEENG